MPPLRPDAGRPAPDWRLAALTLANRLGLAESDSNSTTNVEALVGIDDADLEDAYERGRVLGLAHRP